MSRPHGLVSSPRCLIVIIKLFSFQSTTIGLLSFLFSMLSTNDYATYHPNQTPVVVYPINPSSMRAHSLSGLAGPWLRAEGMLLVLKVYETCDLTVCPARDIFFNFMYILYLNFRKISNFQAYMS